MIHEHEHPTLEPGIADRPVRRAESLSYHDVDVFSNSTGEGQVKVFISWSGELSHQVALALHGQLPLFIHAAVPWVSSEDIAKGVLWRLELAKELNEGSVGIFCVTRQNVASPWVNFEAGALSKTPEASRVIPYLFQMRPSDVKGPLSDFQGAVYERGSAKNKEEFRKLLVALNSSQSPPATPEAVLNATFEKMWPDFSPKLDALAADADGRPEGPTPEAAALPEVLEEVLQTVRDQRRMLGAALGDERWTFRGNARLDPLSPGDYRQLALGLAMLKTLADIERLDEYKPDFATIRTLLMLRDPLEVLLARAHAPHIHSVYFDDEGGKLRITYKEEDREVEESADEE